jgi:hypothetical protein
MAVKLSTGLRNAILSGQELRKVFEDAIINIYTGTAPAGADDAATGTLLVTISKASGTVSPGEVSTAKEARVQITSHAGAETFSITINGATYTFTNPPDAGTAADVAKALALLVDQNPNVEAHAAGTDTIYIRSKIAGLSFTISVGGTGTSVLTDDAVANGDADTLNLGEAAAGVIQKNGDVWSGVAVAGGTAGYFRMVKSDDDGLLSNTRIRLQGNVATSGQEMTLSSTTIALGATQTIDSASITMPAS